MGQMLGSTRQATTRRLGYAALVLAVFVALAAPCAAQAVIQAPAADVFRVGVGHRVCVTGSDSSATLDGPGPSQSLTGDADGCWSFAFTQAGAWTLTYTAGGPSLVLSFTAWGDQPAPANHYIQQGVMLGAILLAAGFGWFYALGFAAAGFIWTLIPNPPAPFTWEAMLFLVFIGILTELTATFFKSRRTP